MRNRDEKAELVYLLTQITNKTSLLVERLQRLEQAYQAVGTEGVCVWECLQSLAMDIGELGQRAADRLAKGAKAKQCLDDLCRELNRLMEVQRALEFNLERPAVVPVNPISLAILFKLRVLTELAHRVREGGGL